MSKLVPQNPYKKQRGEGSTSPAWEVQSLQQEVTLPEKTAWRFLAYTQNLHILRHRTTE